MVFVAQFAAFAACSFLWYLVLRNYLVKGALTDSRFALILVGWFSLALLGVFFVSLLVLGIRIDPPLMRLGLGIAVISVVIAYPVAYYSHKFFLAKWLRAMFRAPERHSGK